MDRAPATDLNQRERLRPWPQPMLVPSLSAHPPASLLADRTCSDPSPHHFVTTVNQRRAG